MKRILVTGASGLLGCTVVSALRREGHCVATAARRGGADHLLDLGDRASVKAMVESVRPTVVIHLAGASNVDSCEKNPNEAYLLNVKAVEHLVAALGSSAWPTHLLHISTDHVYDGSGMQPEPDVTIRNMYAMSKLAGEQAALRAREAGAEVTVLRVNFFGRSHCTGRSSFSDWVVQSLRSGQHIAVFTDVWFSPLRMETLASAFCTVLASGPQASRSGVFNLGSADMMSKAMLAQGIAKAVQLDPSLLRDTSIKEMPHLATRPCGMAMDSHLFESVWNLRLPTLAQELQALAKEYAA